MMTQTKVRMPRVRGGGTCPVCKRTFKKEEKQHFRNVYREIQLRLCNKCYFQNEAAEEEEKKKKIAAEKKEKMAAEDAKADRAFE